MVGAMKHLEPRFTRRSRLALLLGLTLLTCANGPTLAAAPAKGTEILWDTYGIPHIFAPDHASLFHAYGYAQMEGHSELLVRLYAQARGRGAEFYGDAYLDSDRWVRTTGIPQKAKVWASQQTPEFARFIRAFACRSERVGDRALEHGECDRRRRSCRSHPRMCTRTACASSTTTGSPARTTLRGRMRREEVETHGSNGWAIAPVEERLRKCDAA